MSKINEYPNISNDLKEKILSMYKASMQEDSDKYSFSETKDNYLEIDSLYCYEKDNEILGFINLFTPNQNEYYLYPFVHPDHRNMGIFKELLNHIIKELKKIPAKKTDTYQTPVFMLPLMKECKNFNEVSKIYNDLTKGQKEIELLMSINLTKDMYTPTKDIYITRTFPEENQIVSKIIKKENKETEGYFSTSLFEDKSACMTRVFVKPEYRGLGLQKSLAEKIMEYAGGRFTDGYATIHPLNTPSMKNMKGCGFTVLRDDLMWEIGPRVLLHRFLSMDKQRK